MYHGGTNFGRTAGNFIATSYDYDAPIDEYGLVRQPKYDHLRDLHKVIKKCEPILVYGELTVASLGDNQQSYVYRSKSGACAAFLANNDTKSSASVTYNGMSYELPPWSISILPDCKTAVYNTARVRGNKVQMKMSRIGGFSWKSYKEQTYNDDKKAFMTSGLLEQVNMTKNFMESDKNTFTDTGLLEQVNVTRDRTDYLWYTTHVNISENEQYLKNGQYLALTVSSAGPSLHIYINGQLTGIAFGGLERSTLTYTGNVKLRAGMNKISLLSATVGLYNGGTHYESWNYGVLGPVILNGLNEGKRDLSWGQWIYQVGLQGEALNLYSFRGISSVNWGEASKAQPLTWYKAFFNAPEGNDPLALDMNSMGKGLVWINGHNIGRYWPSYKAHGACNGCDYRGHHNETVCISNCGESSQRWYHLPRSWLNPTDNLIVVFEEWGGDPNGISLVKRVGE
ncbi:beta-galactosidase-like isoform X1 [Asparagus officinalis]|nr:beta-galactosidase-like isoform X1 [Asparagus officinalis]